MTWHLIVILICISYIMFRAVKLTKDKVSTENENAKMKTAGIILNIFYIILIISVYGGLFWW